VETGTLNRARSVASLALVYVSVVLIRITAPSDLATGDQPLQVAYIRDVVEHDNWIVQHLEDGTPAAKPPLYNWLAAGAIAIAGRRYEVLLKLPSLIAGLLTLFLTWSMARSLAGERAALIAGLLLTASTMFSKQVYFARTDMLLTALIVLQMYAALRLRPELYWFGAALALLTKGPIGLLIPALACSAWWWSGGEFRERWRSMRWTIGLPVSLALFAAWFGAAVAVGGQPVFDQLVFAETLDRFAAHSSKSKENRHILYYIPHFLVRMAPASLFAVIALPALWRQRKAPTPAVAPHFAAWWLVTTFVFLSLIPSKRADRLFPLFPAACILAGWVIDRFATEQRVRGTTTVLGVAAIVFCAGSFFFPTIPAIALFTCGAVLALATRRRDPMVITAAMTAAMLIVIGLYQYLGPPHF